MTDPGEGPDRRFYSWLATSPYGAALTLRFAQDLVVQERVGLDDAPDLLFVGISSADFVGHRYGPFSREAQDYYLQLDTFLGDFLSFLDERVGEHAYTVALSADHGALAMPEELTRRGQDAGRFDPRPFFEELRALAAEAAESGAIPSIPRLQYIGGLVFQFEEAAPTPRELAAFRREVADLAMANAFVAEAFTYEELRDGTGAGVTYDRHRRSFHPDRSADVVVSLRERYLLGAQPVGTSHGSPWDYDTHVPLVLAGPGISAGENGMRARTADLAPTIARLFQIPAPADLDGRVLEVGPVVTR